MSLSSEQKEKINFLEEFDSDLETWFSGQLDQGDKESLRKSLNERAPLAEKIVDEAGCLHLMVAAPPSIIGGPILDNLNPFNSLFDDYYGSPFIHKVRDMTQKAIGVIRSGRLEEVKEAKKIREASKTEEVVSKELAAPDKVTLLWLHHHVPVNIWLIAGGVLLTVFIFGIDVGTWWQFVKDIFGSTKP